MSLNGPAGTRLGGPLTAAVTVDGIANGAAVQVAAWGLRSNNFLRLTANTATLAYNATTLIIAGTGCSSGDNVQFSGGATGIVTSVTPTQFTVTSLRGLTAGSLLATVTIETGDTLLISATVQVATVGPGVAAGTAALAANATTLVIHGFAFSSIPANDTVTFSGGAAGIVTAATATTLTVSNLSGLTIGSLTATVTWNELSSVTAVQVATVFPALTRSTASLTVTATSLIINGVGFDPNPANDIVIFSDRETGTVTCATANQLTVTNLHGLVLGSLPASVTADGHSSGTPTIVGTASAARPCKSPRCNRS